MKVLFAGTPEFAVPPLRALAQKHEIVGVYTQPDRRSGRGKKITPPAIKVLAKELNLEVHQPTSLKDQVEKIQGLKPDVMVVVAYGMLLPQSILDIPKHGCINIHASILPRWRGAAPIHRAIEAGDDETGVSIMRMELGLDTGPVYQTLRTSIEPSDTTSSLHDRLAELGATGICQTLELLAENPKAQAAQQEDAQACYAKKLEKSEANIDWALSATQINQKIRAFIPFPISQCNYAGKRIRVWQSTVVANTQASSSPGRVVDIDELGPVVQCGTDCLRLEIMQRDGGKALPWKEFKNGFAINSGDVFC